LSVIPWTEKYAPKRVSEIVKNTEAAMKLLKLVKEWKPGSKGILLYGPPGTGKTVSVYAVANELNYEVIEMNASDTRNVQNVMRIAGSAAMQAPIFAKRGRIVLIDEIDGLSGREDRGGLGAIIKVIKNARVPVVLTANDPWDPKFASLRQYCQLIAYKRLTMWDIVKVLRSICQKEGIIADNEVLKGIAKNAEGDLRSAINDLQALAEGRKKLTKDMLGILARRDREKNIFEVLRMIFSAKTAKMATFALSMADVDYEMLMRWISENIPSHMEDAEELAKAYDALSRADVFLGRIKREQNWKLLPYAFELMSAGVALARNKSKFKFVKYSFPSLLKEMKSSKVQRDLQRKVGEKIKKRCHTSVMRAINDFLPFIRVIFKNNPEMGAKMARWFRFNEEEIAFITGDDRSSKEIIKLLK